jgi:hypothetical protein
VCELLLPINLFWEVEQLLKRLDYMIASHEDPVVLTAMQQTIYRKIVKYVVSEKERAMLYEMLKDT